MSEDFKKQLKDIDLELRKRKFVDTDYLNGLLAKRAMILLLNRYRLV